MTTTTKVTRARVQSTTGIKSNSGRRTLRVNEKLPALPHAGRTIVINGRKLTPSQQELVAPIFDRHWDGKLSYWEVMTKSLSVCSTAGVPLSLHDDL